MLYILQEAVIASEQIYYVVAL